MTSLSDLVHNERLKLTATWLNTMGAASIAIGALTPAAVVATPLERGGALDWGLLLGSAIWVPVGISLHLSGRYVLGALRT